jgi:myo-inositol 2-dehydrogenase/D-chiro-inositol 1-dehydrogenase
VGNAHNPLRGAARVRQGAERGERAAVRVAVLGAGRIGRRHARTLANQIPMAELVVIADAIEDAARETASLVGVPRWTTDSDSVIGDPEIDAVLIASSTETHAPLIIAASEAGKDIFCEKPIALDLETTDRAIEAAAKAGVRLQIGFNRRFDRGYRKAKAEIAAGKVGTVESIRDTMRDPAPPPRGYVASSGGLFRDMTIHNFDCVRWLAGCEAIEVSAMAACLVDPMFAELGDVDTSIVTLRFESGALAVIDNSRRSGFGYDVRTEVFGSEGALMIGYSRDTPMLRLDANGIHSDHIHWFLERFDQAYIDELKVFVDSIVDDTPPPITGEDARAALALAYAAEASRRENAPVSPARFDRA